MINFGMWELLNIICRMAIVMIVVVKLVWFYDQYRMGERVGLGVAGGCSAMTIRVVMDGPNSPFAPWATTLFTIGVLIYFIGRLNRQIHHWRANKEQIRRAIERRCNRG